MLLGARQFFERRGAPTPPIPYDAEVEYLESTGTQYIDTGVSPKSTVGAEIVFSLTDTTIADRCVLMDGGDNAGWRWGFSTRVGTVMQVAGVNAPGASWNNYALPLGVNKIAYNYANDKCCYLNSTLIRDDIPYGDTARTSTIWLNASYNAGVGSPWRTNYLRVYSLRMSDSGVIIRDLIPVRFTNDQGQSEGAMYDRVSGALFRNAGTGAFVIGSDKS